ncbi:tetratricopeptide repeat protein [Methylomonas paludis]|uniref:Tetratricopeptide repeat protein n=1 Tax=Methylomonas paludis TaxID=1173101 RepID=A0A975R853_9GAMM|nr:tetratricopeptide repeat protein [Methylomonas paludis]QWF69557.1 tetratricopeptide repeat protein [Methylomonas paludis]
MNAAHHPVLPLLPALTWLEQGNALHAEHHYEPALQCYAQAIAEQPDAGEAYWRQGNTLLMLGRHAEAVVSYDRAIACQPAYAKAYNNRGMALQRQGLQVAALDSFTQALALQPDSVNALLNRSRTLQNLQRHSEALAGFAAVMTLRPDDAELHLQHGLVLKDLSQYAAALISFERALALNPTHAGACCNCGLALYELKQPAAAIAYFKRASELQPDFAAAYNNCGLAQLQLKQYAPALLSFDQALLLCPDFTEALNNRGNALHQLKRYADALLSYDQALARQPDYAEAFNNRGITLDELNRHTEAIHYFEQAIRLKPDYAAAYLNRGCALQNQLQLFAALEDYNQAIALKPDFAPAYWNKALLMLLNGDYQFGWQLYEWRWKAQIDVMADFPQPLWLGVTALTGKIILIHPEQGLGDFIQFCRYAYLLEAAGAKVVIQTPRSLFNLLSGLNHRFTIVAQGQPLPAFDLHCPLLSLPLAFKTGLDNIPATIPYLSVSSDKQQLWRNRLGPKSRQRIGIVWSGSATHKNDHKRSIPLALLKPLFCLPVEWHCLQIEFSAADRDLLETGLPLYVHQQALADFADTAALIDAMDLVISIDTSVAHLAGALAKPVWILLPFAPDFRWLLARRDCPWYPTATLWRQSAAADWDTVIADIVEQLPVFIETGTALRL